MDNEKLEQLRQKFWSGWNSIFRKPEEEESADVGREKVVVFIVAVILAFCLWLIVNLSRDYNLNINLPIALGEVPPDRALADELPTFATVSITGEGWKLLNIYNNPPQIYLDITQDEVNLYDQVRQQMNALPDVGVEKVQPLFLNIDLEEKASKKVPVIPHINVSFKDQYGFVDTASVVPDSITVSGAASLIQDITQWETDSLSLQEVEDDISVSVDLKERNPLLSLSQNTVTYRADVIQYTEGEARVFVQTRNMPQGRTVSFSPSFITVKYDVPINEYAQIKDLPTPFTAYVTYQQIQQDSTGFVVPQIEQTVSPELHLNVRSFQPAEVAYFMVVGN